MVNSEAVGSSLLTTGSLEKIISPIIVLKRELLPAPIDPMTQTNSPFLTVKPRFLRINSYFGGGESVTCSGVASSCP
jgi:hypothetical protein